jgi:phage gp45-like
MLDRISSAIKNQVTRGKVVTVTIGGRTFLQVTGLDGVVQQTIEMLLPPGYSANPASGSDVVLLQVMGSADHVVALGGDFLGNAIGDLAPGEFGFSNGTQMVIVRTGYIEMVSPTYILANTPTFKCTGEIIENCNGASVTLGTHTHGAGLGGHTTAPDGGT